MNRGIALAIALILLSMFLAFPVNSGSIKSVKGFESNLWQSEMVLYAINEDGAEADCSIQPYEKIPGGYHLLTAGHCVQLIPADVEFAVADEIGGRLTPVTLIKAYYGDSLDFATFEMKTSKVYPVMELGDENDARVDDEVLNPNFGYGLGKQIGHGRISSDSLGNTPDCNNCAGAFLIQIFGASGSSGSAVILKKNHKVIGLVVGQWHGNIGMGVMPISAFKTFLTAPAQPHPGKDPSASLQNFIY